jgi:hypothetical protein
MPRSGELGGPLEERHGTRQVRVAAVRGEPAVGRRALVDHGGHLFSVGAQSGHRLVGSR